MIFSSKSTLFVIITHKSFSERCEIAKTFLALQIGSFFMINLCLVVIATQFSETKRRETAKMKAERARFRSSSTLSSFTNSETTNCYLHDTVTELKTNVWFSLYGAFFQLNNTLLGMYLAYSLYPFQSPYVFLLKLYGETRKDLV